MPFCKKHQHAYVRVCSECHVEGGYKPRGAASMTEQDARKLIDIKTETFLAQLNNGSFTVAKLSKMIQTDFHVLPMSDIAGMAAAMSIYMNTTSEPEVHGPKCQFQVLFTERWTFKDMNGDQCKGYIPKARWDGKPKRCPNKGEYYISGAIPAAWIAPCDMKQEYYIAERIS